jgi:predicted nucleic-acid-binding Zn-ribbon protein
MPKQRFPAPSRWEAYYTGVAEWLGREWGSADRPCPYCTNTEWEIGEVVALYTAPGWPLSPGSEPGFYPVIQVACTKCKHTVLVNALAVFEPQQRAEHSAEHSEGDAS